MDHPRSKLPAVLAILFCIALLGGVGVLLWKTLPEKQQPQQAETIQTDSVFSSEQTAVEPEREAPYEGELPEQAEAAQPEQPDSEQPSEPAADPAAPDDTPVTDAQKTAQATLASMTEDEKLWQLFFVTPEAITNVNTATVAGEATKNALAQYPVGGIVYFAKNLEDRAQAAALLANTQSYAKIPLFLGVDEEGGTVSRIGANEALGGTKVADMRSFGQSADVSMLDALMKKVGAEYTFDATASAEDAAGYKTIIIASGASSKGLGAAGISQEDEIARAEAIAQTAKDNDITVIVAHMGGAARRGTLSDQFSDLALGCADYIMVVEEGNDDGKFSDAATDAGIPITMLYTIADAVTPLQEIFGA